METNAAQIGSALRARLEQVVGGWDDEVEAVALGVLRASDATEFYDAERKVAGLMRSRGDQLVAAVLEHRCTEPEHVEPARARAHASAKAQGWRLISNARRKTRVQLLGGLVVPMETLRLRPVMPPRPGRKRGVGRRGEGGTGFYPVLAELGITGLATPALMAEVAREVAESSSVAVARASLKERGLDIPHKTALRLTYQFAQRALEVRDAVVADATQSDAPDSGELEGKRVVVSVDGGRMRIRENPKSGRRNAKTRHRRYKAPWKEPKVMTIYVTNDAGERDKQFRVVLDATMGDADAVLTLMVGHLRLRGAHRAKHITLVADGAEWIWGRADTLRAAVGLPAERFTQVVDYYHACEHLHDVAAIPKSWSDDDRTSWLKKAKHELHAGRVDAVLDLIASLKTGRRAPDIANSMRYFKTHRDRMRYGDFRALGCPCGSGAVESAVRRVVNLRMKGNSIYWLPEHAEAMLHLRAYLKAGRWDDLVRAAINYPAWQPPAT